MTDKLDALIAHAMDRDASPEAGARILQKLARLPLPPQRGRWWPASLLAVDLSPAWPRIAALAGAAVLGLTIGLAAPDPGALDRIAVASAATDLDLNLFDPEPLTGARP
jgi:hypothetical protein